MDETEQYSALIGDIYDAVLDPATWPDVLSKAASFVGRQAGGLLSRNVASRSADGLYTFGVDPHYMQLYLDQYAKLDPTLTAFFFFGIGEVVSTTDLMPYAEFRETRFYRERARPQGWVDSVQAILEKSLTSFAHVSLLRNESSGLADEGTRRRMQLVVPHGRRAVLIGKVISLKSAEAASFADTLDGLSAGMFLVDARGRILHANASGHALLANGSVLRAAGGKLAASDPYAEQASIALDLENRIKRNGEDARHAETVLGHIRGSDTLTGFFGGLGRKVRGTSDVEAVVDTCRGTEQDVDIGFWNIEWLATRFRDTARLEAVATVIADLNLDI